jgi:hypothetical protein
MGNELPPDRRIAAAILVKSEIAAFKSSKNVACFYLLHTYSQ